MQLIIQPIPFSKNALFHPQTSAPGLANNDVISFTMLFYVGKWLNRTKLWEIVLYSFDYLDPNNGLFFTLEYYLVKLAYICITSSTTEKSSFSISTLWLALLAR